MVEFTKRTPFQQYLLKYYDIYWIRIFNSILYFVVEILLFIILTILPIKITFGWLLDASDSIAQQTINITILIVFVLHIYIYLDHKIKKLIHNPQIKKKILFQNKIIKLKWLSLITVQFVYDVVCLILALYQVLNPYSSLQSRLLQLVYSPKIYKIKMFHDRFLSYIIGTSFYIIYNVFYGLFILIIIVSYVGCIFYEIDRSLYNNNYQYLELLWVYQSAWNDIIQSDFGIQLLYTIYWSLGTASSAAYGNVSASAPDDVIFNIVCLYFEGFLFGFYLSRIHSLPQLISKRENQLLEIFQQFETHKMEIKRSERKQKVQKDLYFKILCSLQYQETRKKSMNEIQSVLPKEYIIEIKTYIFRNLLEKDVLGLWKAEQLKQKLCLSIHEITTQVGEQIYHYNEISYNDLIFVKEGTVTTNIILDQLLHFDSTYKQGDIFGLFTFITNIKVQNSVSICNEYCNIYFIKRDQYKSLLNPQEKIYFESIFNGAIHFQNQYVISQSIGKYQEKLSLFHSDVLFLDPRRKSEYVLSIFKTRSQKFNHPRRKVRRDGLRSQKLLPQAMPKSKTIGIQCCQQDSYMLLIDHAFIL